MRGGEGFRDYGAVPEQQAIKMALANHNEKMEIFRRAKMFLALGTSFPEVSALVTLVGDEHVAKGLLPNAEDEAKACAYICLSLCGITKLNRVLALICANGLQCARHCFYAIHHHYIAQGLSDRIYSLGAECVTSSAEFNEFLRAISKRLAESRCGQGPNSHTGVYIRADAISTPLICNIMSHLSPDDADTEVTDRCIVRGAECAQCGSDVIRLSKVLLGSAYAYRACLFRSETPPQGDMPGDTEYNDEDIDFLDPDFLELN